MQGPGPPAHGQVVGQGQPPGPVQRVGGRGGVHRPGDPPGGALDDQPQLRHDPDPAGHGQQHPPAPVRAGPPADRQGGQGQDHHHLPPREPPAVHGQGHEGGHQPAGGQRPGHDRPPGGPPPDQGGHGRDGQQPRRLPGGHPEPPVHQQAEQPPAPPQVVRVGPHHRQLPADEVVAGRIRRPPPVPPPVQHQEHHPGRGQPRHQPQRPPSPPRPDQPPAPDQGQHRRHRHVLDRQPRQRHHRPPDDQGRPQPGRPVTRPARLRGRPPPRPGAREGGDGGQGEQGGGQLRVELAAVDGQGRGAGEHDGDQGRGRERHREPAHGGPEQQAGQQPGHRRHGQLGPDPAAGRHRTGQQQRQQRVVGAEAPPVGQRLGLGGQGQGVERPPAGLGQLVGDVEVAVGGQADRGEQVLRLVGGGPGLVGRRHRDPGRRDHERQQPDHHHRPPDPGPVRWGHCPGGRPGTR